MSPNFEQHNGRHSTPVSCVNQEPKTGDNLIHTEYDHNYYVHVR